MPTPRGLSQAPTSFIGSWCQGIHHVLLVACRHKDARVHCEVLKTQPETHPPTHAHPETTTTSGRVRGMSSPAHTRNQPTPTNEGHTTTKTSVTTRPQQAGVHMLIPQDPTVCSKPPTPQPTRFPHHTDRAEALSSAVVLIVGQQGRESTGRRSTKQLAPPSEHSSDKTAHGPTNHQGR